MRSGAQSVQRAEAVRECLHPTGRLLGHLHPGLQGRAGLRRRPEGPRLTRQETLTSVNGFAAPNLLTSARDPEVVRRRRPAPRALGAGEVEAGRGLKNTDSKRSTPLGVEVRQGRPQHLPHGPAQRRWSGKSLLAWVVEVSNRSTVRETVVIDAASGKPVNRYSMIHAATDRELVEKHTPDAGDDATVWTARTTPSPARSTRTSRTRSSAPASPTGSSRTPSAATPTTATARR